MDAGMLAWCESRGLTVLGKMSEGYDGATCHPLHGRHWHCANCGEMSSYQGHMMGKPPAFTCQPAASTTREEQPASTQTAISGDSEHERSSEV